MSVATNIVCFSWNAGGLKFCKTQTPRGSFSEFFSQKCLSPDFLNEVVETIDNNTRFAVFSTEDEDASNTYFHSNYLPTAMSTKGLVLYKGIKLAGVGDVTAGTAVEKGFFYDSKTIFNPNSLLSGDDPGLVKSAGMPKDGALRLSVYCRKEESEDLKEHKNSMEELDRKITVTSSQNIDNFAMGGAAISATMSGTPITFAAVSIGYNKAVGRELLEAKTQSFLATFGNKINTTFGDYNAIVFLMGDFATNVQNNINDRLEAMQTNDKQAVATILANTSFQDLQEGVDGAGHTFPPTWHRRRGKGTACSPSA